MDRSILYVDGFNFYHGVTNHWKTKRNLAGLGWCDFRALVERHFPLGGATLEVKWFPAPVKLERKDEQQRFALWTRAVQTISEIGVLEGFPKAKGRPVATPDVPAPEAAGKVREDKQSDINLAIEVMLDALGPHPLKQIFILSDDRDLMPVVFALRERIPTPVEVTVLLPSRADARNWQESYKQAALRLEDLRLPRESHPIVPAVVSLTEEQLACSLLHYTLTDFDGEFECPQEWRLNPTYLDRICPLPEWRPDARSEKG